MSHLVTREIQGKRFVRACSVGEMPKDRGLAIEFDDLHDVAVFHIDGTWYAVSNVCPHKRLHVLCNGLMSDRTVQCPMHGWRFDVRTGKNLQMGASLRTYAVIELEGWAWVEWPDDEAPAWTKGL